MLLTVYEGGWAVIALGGDSSAQNMHEHVNIVNRGRNQPDINRQRYRATSPPRRFLINIYLKMPFEDKDQHGKWRYGANSYFSKSNLADLLSVAIIPAPTLMLRPVRHPAAAAVKTIPV